MGFPPLRDQEVGRKGYDLPVEEELKAGGGALQTGDRQEQDRHHRVETAARIGAVEAGEGDDQPAGDEQRPEQPRQPLDIARDP